MNAPALKVLVVDDEPPIRKLLRMGLAAEGYQVIDAPNGKAALAELPQKPDVVILDLGLPDVQGLELLRALREKNEGIPIVVLSSRADEAAKIEALDLGADDYVTKPFSMNELMARIRAAVAGRRPCRCPARSRSRCSRRAASRCRTRLPVRAPCPCRRLSS